MVFLEDLKYLANALCGILRCCRGKRQDDLWFQRTHQLG